MLLTRTVDGGPIPALSLNRAEVIREFNEIVQEAGITEVREGADTMKPFLEGLQAEGT